MSGNFSRTLLTASDATSQTSTYIDSGQVISISFMAYFSDGAAGGTLKIQASNDPVVASNMIMIDGFAPTNWVDVPSATATVTAGVSVIIPIPQNCYRFLRAVYTSSSAGSGTITINTNTLTL